MAQYYPQQQPYGVQSSAQNLQFYPSSYTSVSGHTTPSQASYGRFGGAPNSASQAYPVGGVGGGYGGFGSPSAGVSGRMGEQGGLRTGWLAAFGTEGYDGEPPLLEELGVNFEHIRTKVCTYCKPPIRGLINQLYSRSSSETQAYHCSYLIDPNCAQPFCTYRPTPHG